MQSGILFPHSNTLNGDDNNETAEKEKRPFGAGAYRRPHLYEIRTFYQQGRAALLPCVAHQYLGAVPHQYRNQDTPSDDGAVGATRH